MEMGFVARDSRLVSVYITFLARQRLAIAAIILERTIIAPPFPISNPAIPAKSGIRNVADAAGAPAYLPLGACSWAG